MDHARLFALPRDVGLQLSLNGQQFAGAHSLLVEAAPGVVTGGGDDDDGTVRLNFFDAQRAPAVATLSPESGSMNGGSPVTFRGSNFGNVPSLVCAAEVHEIIVTPPPKQGPVQPKPRPGP